MQIVINSADLRTVTRRMSGVVNPDAIIEIMQCVLFQASVNKATFTGTDSQITIVTSVPCLFDQGVVQFAIPMRDLKGLVDGMPGNTPVTITVDGTNITASAGKLVFNYVVLDATLFYKIPDMGKTTEHPLAPELVAALINASEFAALTSVTVWQPSTLLDIKGSVARAVATDGHGMYISKPFDFEGDAGNVKVLLPKGGIKTLQSFGTFAGLSLVLPQAPPLLNAVFKSEDMTVYVRLIDSEYVDYQAAIPTDYNASIALPAEDFMGATRSIAVGTGTMDKGVVVITVADLGMSIVTHNYGTNKSGNTDIPIISSDNGDIRIGFSSSLLIKCLSKMTGTTTIRHGSAGSRPILIEDESGDALILAMPSLIS